MIEHDWEKIDSVVSKYSANLKNLAENPQNWRSLDSKGSSFLDVWF